MSGTPPQAVDMPENINDLCRGYVHLRDRIKEVEARNKEQLAPAKSMLDEMEIKLQTLLQAQGMNSVKTESGTVYLSEKANASIGDSAVFRQFIIDNKLYDMADWKANALEVREYIEAQKSTPPGVNYTTVLTVGVRRK